MLVIMREGHAAEKKNPMPPQSCVLFSLMRWQQQRSLLSEAVAADAV